AEGHQVRQGHEDFQRRRRGLAEQPADARRDGVVVTEKERGGARNAAPQDGKTTTGFPPATSPNAKQASRAHRPHRRLSDKQLIATIQSLRDEQRYRREDARLYHSEADRYRPKGARYRRTFQLDVMRRKIRVWP